MDRSAKALLAIIAVALITINIQLYLGLAPAQETTPTFGEWKAAPFLRKNAVKDRAPIVIDIR